MKIKINVLVQIFSMLFLFKLKSFKDIVSFSNTIQQQEISRNQPHYPSKIFIQSQRGFNKLLSQNQNISVVYYSKNIKKNQYTIIFQIDPSQQYQGIKFKVDFSTNKIIFIEDFITPNLNFLLKQFGLKSLSHEISKYYPNLTKEIRESFEFKQYSEQQNLSSLEDQLGQNLGDFDVFKQQLLENQNLINQHQSQTDFLKNFYDPNGDISSTILGTRSRNIKDFDNDFNNLSTNFQKPNKILNQFNLEQQLRSIQKRKAFSALIPGISSWSLLKNNKVEFQIFLSHLELVIQNSQQQYLQQNLGILFEKYNLQLKNMNQDEIQELKSIVQNKIFQVDQALTSINMQNATRQMQQLYGQGYDFLISTFLFLLKGRKQISQNQAVQLLEYTFKYGKTENLSYNQEIQDLFKDVTKKFICQLILIMQTNQPNMSLEDYIKKEKKQEFQKKHKIHKNKQKQHERKSYNNKHRNNKYKNRDNKKNQSQKQVKKKENENVIYISNLPCNIKLTELNLLFKNFGNIKKLNCFWKDSKEKELTCQIEYESKQNAEEAIKGLDGIEIDNQEIKIN